MNNISPGVSLSNEKVDSAFALPNTSFFKYSLDEFLTPKKRKKIAESGPPRCQQAPLVARNETTLAKGKIETTTQTNESNSKKAKSYTSPKLYYQYLELFIQLKYLEIPIQNTDFYQYVKFRNSTHCPSFRLPSLPEFNKNIQARSKNFTPNMEIPVKVLFQLSENGHIKREDLVACLKKNYGFIENAEIIKTGKLLPSKDNPTIEYKTLSGETVTLYPEEQEKNGAPIFIFTQPLASTISIEQTLTKETGQEATPLINQEPIVINTILPNAPDLEELVENLEAPETKKRKLSIDDELGLIQDLLSQLTEAAEGLISDNNESDSQPGQEVSIINNDMLSLSIVNDSLESPLIIEPIETPPQGSEEIPNTMRNLQVRLKRIPVPIEDSEEMETEPLTVEQTQVLPPFPGLNPTSADRIIDNKMPFMIEMRSVLGEDGSITYDMVDITHEILGDPNLVKVCNWWQLDRFIKDYPLSKQKEIKAQIEAQIKNILKMSPEERGAWYDQYMRIVPAEELGGNRGAGVLSKGIPAWTCFPYAAVLQDEEALNREPEGIAGVGGPAAYAWEVGKRFIIVNGKKVSVSMSGNGRWRGNVVSYINAAELTGYPGTYVGEQNMSAIAVSGKNRHIKLIVYIALGKGIQTDAECLAKYGVGYKVSDLELKTNKPQPSKSDISSANIIHSSTRKTLNSMSAVLT